MFSNILLRAGITGNFSPAFLRNYLAVFVLRENVPLAAVYAVCYLPGIILGCVLIKKHCPANESRAEKTNKKPTSRSQLNMKIIDAGIMDGFTTMIKLAGYIILCTLAAKIIQDIPLQNEILKSICIGSIEVTTGIRQIRDLPCKFPVIFLLSAAIVNFGGLSGLCQAKSMLRSVDIRWRNYVCFKLLSSLSGMLLVFLYYLWQGKLFGALS